MWYKSLTILDRFLIKKNKKKFAFFLSDNLEKRFFALPLHRKTERKCSSSKLWEFSSAGLEHLPYKQRVGGSNPSTPTNKQKATQMSGFCYFYGLGSLLTKDHRNNKIVGHPCDRFLFVCITPRRVTDHKRSAVIRCSPLTRPKQPVAALS